MPLGHLRSDNSKAREWQDKLCTVPGDMCTVLEAWATSCPRATNVGREEGFPVTQGTTVSHPKTKERTLSYIHITGH